MFHSRNGVAGAACQCKECAKQRGATYREKNKKKIQEKDRRYIQENKEKIADRDKIYVTGNREKVTARRAKHYEENRLAQIARTKAWQAANKERLTQRRRSESEKLTDSYIRHVLSSRTSLSNSDIPSELIPLKRLQLLITRAAKEMIDEER